MNFALPPHLLQNRNLSLREQVIGRIMQIQPGFHTKEYLQRLPDYAILTALESAITLLADRSANDAWNAGFEYALSGALKPTATEQEQPKQETSMTQEDFDVLDMELGLIPEVELDNGGTYVFVCSYSGMNFYYEVDNENYFAF